MATRQISGKTEINGEGIKKHFRTTDPWRAIAELAWNGFDAKATNDALTVVDRHILQSDEDALGLDFYPRAGVHTVLRDSKRQV